MLFLGNLSTMLKAGLALAPALVTLTKETKNKYFRSVLQNLYQLIE
jgi:type II secretory pathway component PulF